MGNRKIISRKVRLKFWFEAHLAEIYRDLTADGEEFEGVGYVEFDGEFRWTRELNLSRYPRHGFELDPSIFWLAEDRGAEVVAVIHTHRSGAPLLSDRDVSRLSVLGPDGRRQALFPGVLFGVISGHFDQNISGEMFEFDAELQEFVAVHSIGVARETEGSFS